MTPTEIINAEMQKHPKDQNIEKIGHYLIDRNLDSIPKGKTLMGCMEFMANKVISRAVSYGRYRAVATSDAEDYAMIDEYYGIKDDSQQVTGKLPASESLAIDLADFF